MRELVVRPVDLWRIATGRTQARQHNGAATADTPSAPRPPPTLSQTRQASLFPSLTCAAASGSTTLGAQPAGQSPAASSIASCGTGGAAPASCCRRTCCSGSGGSCGGGAPPCGAASPAAPDAACGSSSESQSALEGE